MLVSQSVKGWDDTLDSPATKEQVSGKRLSHRACGPLGPLCVCLVHCRLLLLSAVSFLKTNCSCCVFVSHCASLCVSHQFIRQCEGCVWLRLEVRWVSLIKWFSTVQQFFEKIVKCLGPLDQSDKYSRLEERNALEQMDFLSFFLFFPKGRTPEDIHVHNLNAVRLSNPRLLRCLPLLSRCPLVLDSKP